MTKLMTKELQLLTRDDLGLEAIPAARRFGEGFRTFLEPAQSGDLAASLRAQKVEDIPQQKWSWYSTADQEAEPSRSEYSSYSRA